jgi:hypothetical protein
MQRPLFPVLLTAAIVFTAYATLVQLIPFRIEKGQNQGDTNMIRAQDYLAKPDSDTVLAGSSLAFRLPLSVLGPHIANLALAGGTPATGLVLLERSMQRPKLVLIEVNMLARPADQAAVQALLGFPQRQLRGSLRAFRTGYDPVNVTERALQALLHKTDEDLIPQPDAIRQMIASQRLTMSRPPDAGMLRRNLNEAAALISKLEARGIRVGFFEMPIDSNLTDLPAEKILRQAVWQRFPAGRFCWLALGVPGGAHTLDGIHLLSDDAALVAGQVVKQRATCLGS